MALSGEKEVDRKKGENGKRKRGSSTNRGEN